MLNSFIFGLGHDCFWSLLHFIKLVTVSPFLSLSAHRYEGCEYGCQICGNVFFSPHNIRDHIKATHKMASDNYIKEYGQLQTKTVMFECQICNAALKRNKSDIGMHLQEEHSLKTVQYGQIYNPSEYIVTVRPLRIGTTKSAQTSGKFEGKKVTKVDRRGRKRGPKSRTQIVLEQNKSPVLKRDTTPRINRSNLNGKGYTNEPGQNWSESEPPLKKPRSGKRQWYHGTGYACQVCSEIFYEANSLHEHVQGCHKMSYQLYLSAFGQNAGKECIYECQICSELISHEENSISR